MARSSLRPVALLAAAIVGCAVLTASILRAAANSELTPSPTSVSSDPEQTGLDPTLPIEIEPVHRNSQNGMRMEGNAEVEILFGDSETFRSQIDNFYRVSTRMEQYRREFSHHFAAVLTSLPRDGRYCPDDVAVPYYLARRAGRVYENLGATLEASYQAIRRLDALGESAGLTPDYRWQVEQVHATYQKALEDYSEMRAVMGNSLRSEMAFRRCNPAVLLRQGGLLAPGANLATAPPRSRSPVTFFIDNRACAGTFHLFLDGDLLGNVIAHRKVALQTQSGRHRLCLIDPAAGVECGQPGTVRTAYIHDGWSMTTHCR